MWYGRGARRTCPISTLARQGGSQDGKSEMVIVLEKRRIEYAEPVVGPKVRESETLIWIREQTQRIRQAIIDKGMHEWHQQQLTHLHRR